MTLDIDSLPINNNPEKSRFELVAGEDIAFIDYELEGDLIRYIHTEVPPALGGKGIAKKLAFAVMEYAVANNLDVEAQCPVVYKYAKEHPEYHPITRNLE
jgi:predicted GNAT family acetyltransferase